MFCISCKGYGGTVKVHVSSECRGLVPEIQEVLSDGSIALYYKNGLTGLVCFPPCTRCHGRGQLRRSLSWAWVARWAARVGFRFPDAEASRYRGIVRRGAVGHECHTASGTL